MKKLLISCPSLKVPHGGIRVIIEWARRLSKWYEVSIYVLDGNTACDWIEIQNNIKLLKNPQLNTFDIVIITSPHAIFLEDQINKNQKCFIFAQMLEHLFDPTNKIWVEKCKKFYRSKFPMFAISEWNIESIYRDFERNKNIFYIGNGVNLKDFPINFGFKDNKTILLEGWEPSNITKDTEYIGPRVCQLLKNNHGYKIIAYSSKNIQHFKDVPDEYYVNPDLKKINELYSRANILIKATKIDARSCSPVEAMTKGTPTARAIMYGDDDLIHDYNCLKSYYDANQLYLNALTLMQNQEKKERMALHCINYVKAFTWDFWIGEIQKIISTYE
jgi:hypothetical protein